MKLETERLILKPPSEDDAEAIAAVATDWRVAEMTLVPHPYVASDALAWVARARESWDTHGFGCAVCVDVAREAMQLYSSGADVVSIRAAIERKWTPGNAAGKTPTPVPPKK